LQRESSGARQSDCRGDSAINTGKDEEKKLRRRECAEQYGVSLPTISAITAWTKIRQLRKLDEPIIEVVSTNSAEGCHADYDNPVKQLWRQKWKEFFYVFIKFFQFAITNHKCS